jgi:hypothetical protein
VNRAAQAIRSLGKHWVWAALNIAGMALYLKLASQQWSLGRSDGLPPGYAYFSAGDAFYWFFTRAVPLAVVLLLDLAILVFIVFMTPAPRRARAIGLWFAVAALWLGTLAVDSYSSPILVDPEAAKNLVPRPPR